MGTRRHPDRDVHADYDEHAVVVTGAEHEAAGVKAVMVSLQRGLESMGAVLPPPRWPCGVLGCRSRAG